MKTYCVFKHSIMGREGGKNGKMTGRNALLNLPIPYRLLTGRLTVLPAFVLISK
jgi:hypothetical protein